MTNREATISLCALLIAMAGTANAIDCTVMPVVKGALFTQQYTGDCVDGMAQGRGRYQIQYGSEGQYTMNVDGNFSRGGLNGVAKLTIAGPSRKVTALGTYSENKRNGPYVTLSPSGETTHLEYRDDKLWEGVVFGTAKGVPYAAKFREGKQVGLCRGDGQGESNCSAADRALLRPAQVASRPSEPPNPNPGNLPRFVPPIINERVRLPDGNWDTKPRYQYPCPSGYYCPPAEEVYPRAKRPVIAPMPTTGIAGAIADVCKEIDCGEAIARSIIRRAITSK